MGEEIEVKPVEGFQGRENEVIIFSTVISNDRNNLGFMEDRRRLNVTMTRARKCFFMVGNLECLADASKMWYDAQHWYDVNGLLRNASEFMKPYERAQQKKQK